MSRAWNASISAVFMLILWAFTCLSGCTGGRPGGPEDVVLLVPATDKMAEAWKAVLKHFEEATKITVVIESVPPETYEEKLAKRLRSRNAPDVALIPSPRVPEFVARGWLQDLQPYLRQQQEIKPADFYPEAWQAYQDQGGQYGVPFEWNVVAVACDLNQLEIASLKLPKPEWTWEDYLKMAQALTVDQNNDGITDIWGTTVCPWWQLFVWQNGGDVVDNPQQPRRSTLSTPAAQEALQFLVDLYRKYKVAPKPKVTAGEGRVLAFVAGRAALAYMQPWETLMLTRSESRWDFVPLPRHKQAANLGVGACVSLPKNARQTEKAWKLIQFLTSTEGQKLLVSGGWMAPARPALVRSEYFAGGMGDYGAGAFAAGIRVAHPLPYTTRYAEMRRIWDEELARLWEGRATVAEATQRIDERVNRLLAEAEPTTAWLLPLTPRLSL